MLLARAATKEDKEKKDGGVAAGPPKKKKQRAMAAGAMAADDVDRFIHNYLAERANANGMLQPQPPRGPPPPYLFKASRSTTGQQFADSS